MAAPLPQAQATPAVDERTVLCVLTHDPNSTSRCSRSRCGCRSPTSARWDRGAPTRTGTRGSRGRAGTERARPAVLADRAGPGRADAGGDRGLDRRGDHRRPLGRQRRAAHRRRRPDPPDRRTLTRGRPRGAGSGYRGVPMSGDTGGRMRTRHLAAVSLAALLLTGCGGSDGNGESAKRARRWPRTPPRAGEGRRGPPHRRGTSDGPRERSTCTCRAGTPRARSARAATRSSSWARAASSTSRPRAASGRRPASLPRRPAAWPASG